MRLFNNPEPGQARRSAQRSSSAQQTEAVPSAGGGWFFLETGLCAGAATANADVVGTTSSSSSSLSSIEAPVSVVASESSEPCDSSPASSWSASGYSEESVALPEAAPLPVEEAAAAAAAAAAAVVGRGLRLAGAGSLVTAFEARRDIELVLVRPAFEAPASAAGFALARPAPCESDLPAASPAPLNCSPSFEPSFSKFIDPRDRLAGASAG